MSREQLKANVLEFLGQQDPATLITEEDKAQLRQMVDELVPFTQVPEPINDQSRAAGVWGSLFASFGAKHSDEKPIRHTSNLAFQSFGNLPMVTVHVTDIHQEIQVSNRAYNNIIYLQNEDRSTNGVVVMLGQYSEDEENPKRYSVAFSNVSLRGLDGQSDDTLRQQFGIEAGIPLEKDFKPPVLHSDIVYLDDDLRVNFGGLGGFYVLNRLDQPGLTIETEN